MADYDLITFGAGFSGLIAANRAAERGLNVVVLEQETNQYHVNNSRVTNGVANIAFKPIDLPEDELVTIIDRASDGHADTNLARAYARHATRVIDWLRQEGIQLNRLEDESAISNGALQLGPHRRAVNGIDWEKNCGDVTLQRLESNLERRGGRVERGARVIGLNMEGNRCCGVTASLNEREVQYSAKAVLAADGGFMGNPEMVDSFITPSPEKLLVRSCPNANGDGMRMANAVGAEIFGLGQFYGHLQHRDAMTNTRLWPYPTMDALAQAGMVVDQDGGRFTDEGAGGVPMSNAIAQMKDPLSTTLILDTNIWHVAGKIGPVEADPYLKTGGGWKHEAGTISQLAEIAGINPDGLVDTVYRYNSAIAEGDTKKLDPPRTTNQFEALPIVSPPFFAIPLCAGITGTMGGLRIDGDARVLRSDGTPITGLYAAGTNTGGLEGGPRVTYAGGLAKAFIWSFAAAEHVVTHVT